jgi:hypothetical protein
MRNKFHYSIVACLVFSACALQAQDTGAAAASERLDASNRQMLWLAFSLYMAVLGIYLLWSESRLRRLEKSARP